MKSLLLLQCYLLFIGYSLADNAGQCQITGIDEADYQTVYTINIDDTQIDTNVLETPYTGTLEVQRFESSANASYFNVMTENDNFVIKTTSEMANFDQNTDKQESSLYLVTLECTLQCSAGTSSLTIRVLVTDVNTHYPQFNLEKYEYKVPSPIMPRTDFSIYGDVAVIATDIDFSNQNVVFTIEPDDFSVTTVSSSTSKDYTSVFAAKSVVQLTGNRTYTITATDSGTNPGSLTSTTTLTLILDESTSFDIPTFESSSYSFNYSVDGTTPTLTELDGPIKILTNKGSSLTDITLTGNYDDYFSAVFDSISSAFELSVNDLLPADSASFIILTLSVSTDSIASTTLIVYLSESEESTTLEFNRHYYTASYNDDSNNVTLDNSIEVNSVMTPVVSLTGEYAEHFDIVYDKKTKSYQITVKSNLTTTEVKSKSYTTVTLKASVNEYYDTAILIIFLPNHTLQFTQALYTATYNGNNTISPDDSSPIGFTTDTKGVKIEISGTYQDNIGIEYNSVKKQWLLVVKKPLSNNTLSTEKELVITLKATDDYDDLAQSVVTIQLPNAVVDAPTFSKSYYLAEYIVTDDTPSITVDEDIIISNRDNQSNIKISLDSYTDYFDISYNKTVNKWIFKVKSALTDDILLTKNDLVVSLTAEEENNEDKGKTVVVISWTTTKEELKFSQARYTGTYPESGTGIIEVQPDISIINVDDINNVIISLDSYTDNFDLSYKSNKWTITINKKLDDSVLTSSGELVITLTAKESDKKNVCQSVLIIGLPAVKEAPKFENIYYIAEYPESGTGTIKFDSDISFTNIEDPKNVAISLDNYVDYFEVKYAVNMWYINIRKSLEKAVLYKNTELVVTMIATEPGVNGEGESALVIKLPTASNGSAPHFSDAYYIAEYQEVENSVIEFENPIRFTNVVDPAKITISLDNYADNFEINYKEDKWHIAIKKELEKTVLLENVELVMSLIATESGKTEEGQSALVLKLPSAVNATAPKFTEPYYIAEYSESGTGIIEFKNPIGFTNVADQTQLTISLDQYSDYFQLSYKSDRWYIQITKSLESSVLYRNTELVMSLIATEDGKTNKGYSALVLNLPTAANGTAPKFANAYYIAEYPESGSGTIGFETPISFTNIDDLKEITITLDKFGDNFEITYESNQFQLNIKKSLDETVLYSNVELVMSLIASEKTYKETGLSALIIKLPTATNGTAPKFLDAYYIAEYPENGTGNIEFDKPIQFANVDATEVSISLDKYATNFEIIYHSSRWYIHINKNLDDNVLHTNVELVMTITATMSESNEVGESALVLKLPTAKVGTAPRFTEAYYLAQYPKNGTGIIEFEKPVTFTNVDDITNIGITIDNYSENLEILYESNKWYIKIIKSLEEALLQKNAELVFTLTATETGNEEKGRSALVLELPSTKNETVIEFSEAYYFARYPLNGSGIIEFESPLKFKNVDNPQSIEIKLSKYSSNFKMVYDGNKWYINITSSLNESVLIENSELVMTLSAYNKSDNNTAGYSVLILSLPSPAEAPKFSKAYYIAEYSESGSGIIEFDSPVTFSNVDNSADVQIALDNYLDYFKIVYSEDRWYINIVQSLEESVLNKNVEIVMTMIATKTGQKIEGDATLVMTLPKSAVAPEFADAYYLAEYPENGTGTIQFESPIAFSNVKDSTTIKISLDRYSSNFDIKYGSKGWYINIKANLDKTILNNNAELIITLTATETDNQNKGRAVLVLKLPAAAKVSAPEFAEAYYIAKYPESGTGTIQFENAIGFLNVNDPETLSITVDTYTDKFAVTYDSGTWSINIKDSLDDEILTKNVELVMTMIATETGNNNEGYSALVLKLPTAVNGTAIKFAEAYYTAEYSKKGVGTAIDIENPIKFLNVDDVKTVTVSLDIYQDNFRITYVSKKWVLTVNKTLDEDILNNNTELVMTLVATNSVDKTEARAALVLKIPKETSPIFSEAYYTAEYPEDVKDVIAFDNAISFKNIADPSKITIKLDNYTDYFDIIFLSNKWFIQINKILENSILIENTELVTTLIATEDNDNDNKGYSALVLKLPTTNATKAPEFSEPVYAASYTSDSDKASVILTDAINITNKEDLNKISITVDNYQENFNVKYDSGTNSWTVNVLEPISESILVSKTDLLISMTATDTANGLKGHSIIDLTLPPFDSKTAPLFSSTYYTGKYAFSDDTPVVTLDNPINITNKDDLTYISISIENYADNFKIQYVAESNKWNLNVVKNLNESVLNSKVDLVMTLTAIDKSSNEAGRCTLVLTLPVINSEEAPKFSSIYYLGQYDTNNGGTVSLNNSVKITNKNDLTKVKISFDDSYKDNFELTYDADSSNWLLNVKSPLNESILKDDMELILTLTATETDNTNIGEAALVLELPIGNSTLPPKFSQAHYSGEYLVDGEEATIVLNDIITVVNKESLTNISVTLDSYETNFKTTYDPTNKRWTLSVSDPIPEDNLKSASELILTLIATEVGNVNTGASTLILALPSSHNNSTEEVVKFSQVHYVSSYVIEGDKAVIEMSDVIKVESEVDVSDLVIKLENEEYAEYFQIDQSSDSYVVTVQTPLPSTILSTYVSLPFTLVAAVDDSKAYATLVINLPSAVTDHAIKFSQPLYEGTYQVTADGTVTFQVNGTIEVETEAADTNVETRITSTTGYEDYFGLSYSNNVLTVVKTRDLPESILRSSSFIPLIITVGITETTDASSAVLNVVIDFSDDESVTPIAFSNVLYSGKYEVTNGTELFTIIDEITVITDEPDSNVEVSVTNEYNHYFTASYSQKVVTVELTQPLSTEIINATTFIPVTLQVSVTDSSYQESAVLNIIIVYNIEEDPGLIQFSTVLYTGKYSIEDGKGHLVLDEDIKVVTDAGDKQIETSISNGLNFAKYFGATYASNTVSVELLSDVPEDLLTNTTLIALTLTIEITGTTHRSSAILNIIIDGTDNGEVRFIEFSDILYNGKYEVNNGIGVLTVDDDITINTSENDSNIAVTISNEYYNYFTPSYSNKVVTISLENQLSSEILSTSSFIPIALQASIIDISYKASAVLNIVIYYDAANDTGLIEFSSVLYNAEYSATDGKGKLNIDEDITVITDRTDDEIEASISTDSEYSKYFGVSYTKKIVSIELKESIPEVILTKNNIIALTLIVSISGTTHRSTAVLNIYISNNNNDNDSNCEVLDMKTVYISVISILSILLIVLMAAAVAFYLIKVRKQNYSNLEEEDGKIKYKKSLQRSSSDIKPATSLDQRRPTGFIFNPISEDSIDGTDSIGEPEKIRRKSVAFDDNVEKLQIEASNEDDNVSEDDNTHNPETTHV